MEIARKGKMIVGGLNCFGLLLRKCWLVRKRQWIASFICEIAISASILFYGWVTLEDMGNYFDVGEDTLYEGLSHDQLIDPISNGNRSMDLMYTPSNPFTDELMTMVEGCLKYRINVTRAVDEFDLVAHSSKRDDGCTFMGVVFGKHTDEGTRHLHYTLRTKYMSFQYLYNSLWRYNMTFQYTTWYFAQTQICLDQSYVQLKSNERSIVEIPQIFIQRVPYPANTRPRRYIREHYISFALISFAIPFFIETLAASKEKFVGMNILMSMNGISNALNLFSWLTSGLLLLSIFCVLSVLFAIGFPIGYSNPFLYYGNPFVLLVFFLCHLAHSICFGMHVSAYFSKSLHSTYALINIYALAIILRLFVLEYVNLQLSPYVGMILPMILLYQGITEIESYEEIGIGTRWTNLFINASPQIKIGGTLGMILILSVIGASFHFVLAVYLYAINPGKRCIGKHPLFFLLCKNKSKNCKNTKNLRFDDFNDKYFEPTSRACVPGIQIRNLKKAYDVSLFNKEKVHALRGVSIDFYKGQITSLLGHNGAGKSTLMAILTGSICPSDGLILIDSKNLKDHSCEILQNIGFYAQDDMYFPNLTVTEQLEFFAMIKRKNKSKITIGENVANLIQKLKLYNVKDFPPNKLCEDQKRKLCLGMAFVGDPGTLILDEPTSRMDYENKRLVWDILLGMRGKRTILISTHDMEEADVLGDRIAIMHEGRIKCYGTSLFLKKMIAGQRNIDVTLSVERWSDLEEICKELDSEANIVERQDKKIIVSVPISSMLSGSLDNFERKKKELGVSAYSLSHDGLEQVFLKVAEDPDDHPKSCEIFMGDDEKLEGTALYRQSVRALLVKKLNCTLKNSKIIAIQILLIFAALLCFSIVFSVSNHLFVTTTPTLALKPDIYDNPYTAFASSDEAIGRRYKGISEAFGARSIEITHANLDDGLLRRAKKNLLDYNNYLIAAAEFRKNPNGTSTAKALYSETIIYSLPISINLLWNAIVKNLLGDYSIEVSTELLPYIVVPGNLQRTALMQGYVAAMTFAVIFNLSIGMFAVQPARESRRGMKHLQRMTGVSGFTYWATTFLVDLSYYAFLAGLLVIGLVCMDCSLGLQLYGIKEIMITILLLMLFAINVLPFVYIFSFVGMKTKNILKLFTFISLGTVIMDIAVTIWKYGYNGRDRHYFIARTSYMFLPYASLLHGQEVFQRTMILNGFCRRLPDEFYKFQCEHFEGLCCEANCRHKKCQRLLPYFHDNDADSLKVSVLFLCATPLLYFGILALLEAQLIKKMLARFTKRVVLEPSPDNAVQQEKLMVFEKIQKLINHGTPRQTDVSASADKFFLAYELRRHFRRVRAVEDISFGINKGECLGLFGVNGSGKSTTFKMMTGEEIPDCGVMYIGDMDYKNHNKQFLSQIGYCPQHDVSIKCLNTHDHLRLFARLRGIAEDQIENEIQAWIQRLNLSGCASQPCGTYSSGNKQRLNIAIALIGNPKLILLDEPTTRVDPGARRSFWNTIKSCQTAGQTFLLASHNMEECEALCERTAIILDGKLIFIGTPKELKQRFGAGYDVQIRMDARKSSRQVEKIKRDMRLLLHCVLTNENSGFLMYRVIGPGTTWRKIYEVMDSIKSKYDCIDDFLVVVRPSA